MKIPRKCLHEHRVEQHGDYCKTHFLYVSYGTILTCIDCQRTYTYHRHTFNRHPIKYIQNRWRIRLYQDELPF